MAINKESFSFTLRIFNWCMQNGIKDVAVIQELCDLILAGMDNKESPTAGDASSLGERYKSLRMGRGLSQKHLADQAGISAHAAREADFGNIAPNVLEKLNKFYGI